MPTGVYPRAPFASRFWSKVDKSGGPDACWLWQAYLQDSGHGQFQNRDGRTTSAHRIAWELTYNVRLVRSQFVCHDCPDGDNPACCNPRHLWLGSAAENNQDAARKGRTNAPRGEDHRSAKLTEKKVKDMRTMHATGNYTYTELALLFGIDRGLAWGIVNRKYWRHVA